ncbi:FUSC family protein [Frankia sp. AgB1.9]|uniref:FUSC family protein n=1 Tax=unclassified Frankia TaxID=2632575 RepID=UPI001932FEC5|nr:MULTISPECIES: FUSC family protein [unclassified Frankia]MBL7547124.1 FUSC family protein [Frankia sp. AgB1.9]
MSGFVIPRSRVTALAAALRSSAVTTAVVMAAVLASFGSALGVEHAAGLSVGVVIQAVVLTITVSRVERRRSTKATPAGHRLLPVLGRLLLLPAVAVAASEVGTLMLRHPNLGDTLFVLGLSGAIWVRRFGPTAARAGTLATLPFIALLIVPAAAGPGEVSRWWSVLMAVIASFWAITLHELADWAGLLPSGVGTGGAAPPVPPTQAPAATPQAGSTGLRRLVPKNLVPKKLPASTKMAAQMAVGLGAAFAVGRWAFPYHWPWLVVTAYIVAAGNRGRGDVAVKSLSRLAGGAVGTVAATVAVSTAPAHSPWTVVAIFVVLAVALVLRNLHYAFWAAGVTSMLALLYGYFGLTSTHVLDERLEAIAVGSVLAVVASWLVLPIRTRDVTRSRVAKAAAALTDALLAVARAEAATLAERRDAFLTAVDELGLIAETLTVRRLVWQALRRPGPHLVDAVAAVRRCREPVDTLVRALDEAPEALADGANRRRAGGLARQLGGVRRAIAGRPEPAAEVPRQGAPGSRPAGSPAQDLVAAALDELADAVATLQAVFSPRPAPAVQPTPAERPAPTGSVPAERPAASKSIPADQAEARTSAPAEAPDAGTSAPPVPRPAPAPDVPAGDPYPDARRAELS